MIAKQSPGSFVSVDDTRRTRKSKCFQQTNTVLAWTVFESALYKVCKLSIVDASGRPFYNTLEVIFLGFLVILLVRPFPVSRIH